MTCAFCSRHGFERVQGCEECCGLHAVEAQSTSNAPDNGLRGYRIEYRNRVGVGSFQDDSWCTLAFDAIDATAQFRARQHWYPDPTILALRPEPTLPCPRAFQRAWCDSACIHCKGLGKIFPREQPHLVPKEST